MTRFLGYLHTAWSHPTHAAEIALGAVLIGAGSGAILPYSTLTGSYVDANFWAAVRLIIGFGLVATATHDVITHMRFYLSRCCRLVAMLGGLATFFGLFFGFAASGSLARAGAYAAAIVVIVWCIGTTSAHKRR